MRACRDTFLNPKPAVAVWIRLKRAASMASGSNTRLSLRELCHRVTHARNDRRRSIRQTRPHEAALGEPGDHVRTKGPGLVLPQIGKDSAVFMNSPVPGWTAATLHAALDRVALPLRENDPDATRELPGDVPQDLPLKLV